MLKKILKLTGILLALGFLGSLMVLGLIIYISFDLPQINSLADYNPPVPSRIYSKDGELLMEIGKEYRDITPFEEIPPRVVESFLAAEDDNFYQHSGVDYIGILRASVKNLMAGRIVQGASTITQQVAKSLLLTSERTFTRKIKDLLLAKKIEDKFTKNEILYLYLNQVYLGGGYYGVKAAVKGYFGKTLDEATIAETALIAGLLVAPGRYSPYVNPQYAKKRQKYVLSRLYKTGKITQQEYQDALKEDIKMHHRLRTELKAGYFSDWIRQRMVAILGEEKFLTNGYEVVTTIDWDLQQKAEKIVMDGAKEIDKRHGFLGPITSFESDEEVLEYNIKSRKKLYRDRSEFFTFYNDGSVQDQFYFDEERFKNVLQYYKDESEKLSKSDSRHVVIGQNPEDPMLEFVKENDNFKAVVLAVNDAQRMIYVDILGMRGMIPYSHFSWAHERKISDEAPNWAVVTRPSTILKKGDQVLVKILSKDLKTPWSELHAAYRNNLKNTKIIEAIKNQNFLLVGLDQEPVVQSALLSLSPRTGEIVTMVGGTDFSISQFNRVIQSNRQPGSAFKPLLYAVALENGSTPASILLDSPQALDVGADEALNWKPRNYDGKFNGPMTFRRALETSRNIPTIRVVKDVGVKKVIDFVDRLQIKAELPKDLSISLGSFGITVLDLVKSYSIFPNGGQRIDTKSIISIKDRSGTEYPVENFELGSAEKIAEVQAPDMPENTANTMEQAAKENPFHANLGGRQVYDRRLAYIMTSLLKGVVQNGTAGSAKNISSNIGGKTGTTNNFVDAWFIGFSNELVTGVWTGFDDNKTMGYGEGGARSALPMWIDFMKHSFKRYPESDFTIPPGIVHVNIYKDSGKLAPPKARDSFMESFVAGTEPGSEVPMFEEKNQESDQTILDGDDYFSAQ